MKMGRIDENLDDDQRFDRLVDGELSDQQRRELLAELDDEPSGWRRCALAFLEAQSWQEDLGAIVCPPAATAPIAAKPRWSRGPGVLGTLVTMAASFLVALATVSVYHRMQGPQGPAADQMAGAADQPAAAPAPSVLAQQPIAPAAADPPQPDTPEVETYMVTIDPPGEESAPFQLPAVRREQIDEQWLTDVPPIMTQDVLEALRRTGHTVRQHRELVPLSLEDGRKLVVPVDELDVQYVGRPAF